MAPAINFWGMVKNTIKPNQNLRAFWKLMNLQDCVWENLYRVIMKTILQEKETIHYSNTIWFTNLFLCTKPWKSPQQRQQGKRNGKNWRMFQCGTWQKSELEGGDRWSKDKGRKSSFCSTDGHLENAELEGKQRSSVLRGDIVKDNSGFYAVFTEQGSSASQITAAKSHGYHFQTTRLRRTSSRRSICSYPGKNGGCSQITENSQSECPDIWIRLPRHEWPESWYVFKDNVK